MNDKQIELLRLWLETFVKLQLLEMGLVQGRVGTAKELEQKLFDKLCKEIRVDRL